MSLDFIKPLIAMRSISKVEDLIEDALSGEPEQRFVTWFLNVRQSRPRSYKGIQDLSLPRHTSIKSLAKHTSPGRETKNGGASAV